MAERDGYFDSDEVDDAFNTPQARMLRDLNAKAAYEAEEARRDRERRRERSRPNPANPAAAAVAASEMFAVQRGAIPMHLPKPVLQGRASYTPAVRPPAPRPGSRTEPPQPGQSGAISNKLALEAIVTNIRASKDPRAAAAEWMGLITNELIKVAQEGDSESD